jgi:hypothetical protein
MHPNATVSKAPAEAFIGTIPTPDVHECLKSENEPTRKPTPAELSMILDSLGAVSSWLHVPLIDRRNDIAGEVYKR